MNTLLIIAALSMLVAANAAELSAPKITVPKGTTTAQAEIRLITGGDKVAAFQTDVVLPSGFNFAAVAGAAATNANKQLTTTDLGSGRMRLILAGLNQNTLGDGTVITLNIIIPSNAVDQSPINFTNASASDINGRSIALSTINGSLSIGAPLAGPALLQKGTLAQIASGGSWKTSIFFLNRSNQPVTIALACWSDAGQPLLLPWDFPFAGQPIQAAGFERTVGPWSTLVVETEAARDQATLAGWASVHASGNISVHAVFRQRVQEAKENEAIAALDPNGASARALLFNETSGFVTGVALANPTNAQVSIAVTARDESGAAIAQGSVPLPPNGHTAFALSDRLPSLRGRMGTLEVARSDGGPVSVLGIRFNPFGSFTSVPPSN